ncbi:MAG: hypothetical protein ACE5GO_11745 [Anaerolineales bacterium]
MHLDTSLPNTPLSDIPAIAKAAETLGFSAIWSAETQHDPFLPRERDEFWRTLLAGITPARTLPV